MSSKIVGVISRLRHFVPFCTLRSIYQSQAAINAHLNKLLLFLLQKRALCLMYFLIQELILFLFFISSKILPIHLYFGAVLHSMYDVSNNSAPKAISEKFVKTTLVHHSYNTKASSCSKYHIKFSRLNQQRNSFFIVWCKSVELSPIAGM